MRLDHFNIRTDDLEGVKDALVDVLGLEIGERPPFSFPGYWLYGEGRALVHLTTCDEDPGNSTGALDHIAFRDNNYDALLSRLNKHNIAFEAREVPGTGMRQVFFTINHDVTVEVGFDPV